MLSGLRAVPVGAEEARAASALLVEAGLHGHRYAIDAIVAEAPLLQRRPVAMLTSDIHDMSKLCSDRVRLVVGVTRWRRQFAVTLARPSSS